MKTKQNENMMKTVIMFENQRLDKVYFIELESLLLQNTLIVRHFIKDKQIMK